MKFHFIEIALDCNNKPCISEAFIFWSEKDRNVWVVRQVPNDLEWIDIELCPANGLSLAQVIPMPDTGLIGRELWNRRQTRKSDYYDITSIFCLRTLRQRLELYGMREMANWNNLCADKWSLRSMARPMALKWSVQCSVSRDIRLTFSRIANILNELWDRKLEN